MPDDDDGVVVTFSEMYSEVRQVHDKLNEIQVELRSIGDHETRIRNLEQKLWIAMGAVTIIASIIGATLAQIIPGA